jgi:hypothetical protein
MNQEKISNPIILINVVTAVLIFCISPMLLGLVDNTVFIAAIPWIATAFPILLIGVVFLFKQGDSVNAASKGLVSGLVMCQTAFQGIIFLQYSAAGKQIPEALLKNFGAVSGAGFLAAAAFLCALTFFYLKTNKKLHAFWEMFPTIGFAFVGLANWGIAPVLGLIGGVLLVIFAFWLLISSITMVFDTTKPVEKRTAE